jgi:predicted DNA-binding transcriptional regulator YafY
MLQSEGKLTVKTLAERLEVSERTVVRDLEALSMSGVPVYAERGSRGGWRLAEGYRTNLTGMKAEEFMSLIISAHPALLQDLGIRDHFDAALQKLLAASPAPLKESAEQVRQKIHIDGAGWHESAASSPCLAAVQEAVWAERKLRIHYQRGREIAVRTINPLGLVAKRSVWYLVAEADAEIRIYRISRIVQAEMLNETFPRPSDFQLACYWEQSIAQFRRRLPRFPAKIRLHERQLERLEQDRYIRMMKIEGIGNGWAEAEMEFGTLEHACWIALSLGSDAEVLAPAELREKVVAELRLAMERYDKPSGGGG